MKYQEINIRKLCIRKSCFSSENLVRTVKSTFHSTQSTFLYKNLSDTAMKRRYIGVT